MNYTKKIFIAIILLFSSSSFQLTYAQSTLDQKTASVIDNYIKTKINKSNIDRYIVLLEKFSPTLKEENKKLIISYFLQKLKNQKIIYNNVQVSIKNNLINELAKKTFTYLELNSDYTFLDENWNLKKLNFSKYYTIEPNDTLEQFSKINLKNEILFKKNSQYFLTSWWFTIKNKPTIESLKNNVYRYFEMIWDEFISDNSYYKISWEWFAINDYNLDSLDSFWNINKSILIKKWNSYIYVPEWKYAIYKKTTLSELKTQVKQVFDDDNYKTFIRWDKYYYVDVENYYTFDLEKWVYLDLIWLKNKKVWDLILIKVNWKFFLSPNYKEYAIADTWLLDSNLLAWKILNILKNEVYSFEWDYIWILSQIKAKTKELVKDKNTDEEKIKAIYSWLATNISYDDFSQKYINWEITKDYFEKYADSNVFSWLGSYNTKIWVCDWITKLAYYMLTFSWIYNVNIETWTAYTSTWNFPHARLKIWEYYYDPTWDLWTSNYRFYKLTSQEIYKTRKKEG